MHGDLAQITLGVLFIVTPIIASFWIIRPFLVPIWAAMIVIATWPLMLASRPRSAGVAGWPSFHERGHAARVRRPFWIAVSTITEYPDNIQEWATSAKDISIQCRLTGWRNPTAAEDLRYMERIRGADARSAGRVVDARRRPGDALAGGRAEASGLGRADPAHHHPRGGFVRGRRDRRERHSQVRRPVPASEAGRRALAARDPRRRPGRRRGARAGAPRRAGLAPSPAFHSRAC